MEDSCAVCHSKNNLTTLYRLNPDLLKLIFNSMLYNDHSEICGKCFKTIELIFEFKKACLRKRGITDNAASSNSALLKVEQSRNIKFEIGVKPCSICLNDTDDLNSLCCSIGSNLKDIIKKCFPEMDLMLKENSLSCQTCIDLLEQYNSILHCFEIGDVKHIKEEYVLEKETDTCDIDIPSFIELKQEELEIKEEPKDNLGKFLGEGLIDTHFIISKQEVFNVTDSKVMSHLCSLCGKSFKQKGHLNRHISSHSGHKKHMCDKCDARFMQKSTLKRHIQNMHVVEYFKSGDTKNIDGIHVCELCSKCFKRKYSLTLHMTTHTRNVSYNCAQCGKSFTQKRNLKWHMRIHMGGDIFDCNYCGRKFTRDDHLQDHMRVHSGKKSYQCELCHKKFVRKRNLMSHITVHAKQSSYKCAQCAEEFRLKGDLIQHLKNNCLVENVQIKDDKTG